MENQLTHKDLIRAKEELEKKVKKLTKGLKERSILKPEADSLFSELFNKHSCIILLQKENVGNQPGKIIMANPVAKKVLGYSEEELRKMNLSDLFDKKTVKKHSKEILSSGIFQFEQTLVSKKHKSLRSKTV